MTVVEEQGEEGRGALCEATRPQHWKRTLPPASPYPAGWGGGCSVQCCQGVVLTELQPQGVKSREKSLAGAKLGSLT